METITGKLRTMFTVCAASSLALYFTVYLIHRYGSPPVYEGDALRTTGLVFFVLSAASGMAAPVMLRTLLHNRLVKQKKTDMKDYLAYNRNLFLLALLTVVFSCVNYLLAAPELYLYGSVLAALWSIYGTMPASKRIMTEMKYYRVEEA